MFGLSGFFDDLFFDNSALAELARTGRIDAERRRGLVGGLVLGRGFMELDNGLLLCCLNFMRVCFVFGVETLFSLLHLKLRSIVAEGFRRRNLMLRRYCGKNGLRRIEARSGSEALRAIAVTATTARIAVMTATPTAITISTATRFAL
jgi:hypothetical protein